MIQPPSTHWRPVEHPQSSGHVKQFSVYGSHWPFPHCWQVPNAVHSLSNPQAQSAGHVTQFSPDSHSPFPHPEHLPANVPGRQTLCPGHGQS